MSNLASAIPFARDDASKAASQLPTTRQHTIIVRSGRPVRLNFRREETASCSDKVVFADFQKSAELPTGQTVAVEFLPKEPGEFGFACPMGMFRGRLIVE